MFKPKRVRFWFCLLFCPIVSLHGCAGNQASKTNSPKTAHDSANYPSGLTSAARPEYRIGVLDQLEIRFYYHERFNETVTVRPDGRITLQLVGDMYVAGMTPTELDRTVTEAYSGIVQSPEVTVFVRGFGGLSAYVMGEVDRPGLIEMRPNMTILQAVAAAGGPIKGAKMNSVVVLRAEAGEALRAVRMDLGGAAIREASVRDDQVLPGDVIYVPRTFIADVNAFLSQIYEGLFPPFDIYLRTLREYNRER